MAQHDYTIANQGFPAFRSDLNDALAAIVSNNSGATEPTTMFAHQVWVDTAANPSILKMRNADNDAWITIGAIDQTGDTFILRPAAGSVSVPAYSTSGDTNTGIFFPAADTIAFAEGGAEAMRIDSSGNVGIGVTPSAWGSGYTVIEMTGGNHVMSNQGLMQIGENSYFNGSAYIYKADGPAGRYNMTNNAGNIQHAWSTAPTGSAGGTITFTERMRIDTGGNLLVGKTSTGFDISGVQLVKDGQSAFTATSGNESLFITNLGTGSQDYVEFRINNGGTVTGSITTNGTGTTYGTASDYRLKENVAPMTGALAKVLELNPVTYTWKTDGSEGQGFIAHELQAICPDAVVGEKDATEIQQVEVSPAIPATYDEEGNELTPAVEAVYEEREVPKYQGVDTSFLVATLTAAIQELSAKNDALEARIAALESGS